MAKTKKMNQFSPVLVPARKWYAIETRSRCDTKVIVSLRRKKIEVFSPQVKLKKQYWDGAVAAQNEPLFPFLLFVKLADHDINTVMQVDGVLHFLYWLNSFAIVSEKDINTIHEFTNNYEKIRVEKISITSSRNSLNLYSDQTLNSNLEKITRRTLSSIGYAIITTDLIRREQSVAV